MLEMRVQQPFVRPALRPPRLNRAHPLWSQKNGIYCSVAQSNGMYDLVSGLFSTNTTTLGGTDENGPYCYSNDSAGTATISQTGPTTSFQFTCWGIIFKYLGSGNRQYIWGFGPSGNTGFWQNAANATFLINNGTIIAFAGMLTGHTYFACQTNSVGTASENRTSTLVELTTGRIWQYAAASTGNLVVNPIQSFTVSIGVSPNRLYAAFATGSVLIPPAVNPASTFWSVDQILGGIMNPWSLWYA
jgi:hypothetical protein